MESISIYVLTIISFVIIHMYAIDLIINTDLFTHIALSRNDCAFNHAYIYIVNFIVFFWFP